MAGRLQVLAVLAPSLAALVAFWPVLDLGYVWDDRVAYVDVPSLRDLSSFWAGTVEAVIADLHYFRPVAMLSFKLQFLLFGDSTVAAHAVGLALHVANTFLLATLAARLAPGAPGRTALAGLLYGLHPALIEPVSWMSCRFDLLVALFLLLALHAELALRRAVARAVTVAALFFLALNSKEMAAPFPAVLVLFQLATRYRDVPWRERPGRMLRAEGFGYALLALVAVVWLALRFAWVGSEVDTDLDVAEMIAGVPERIAFVAETMLFHLRNVLWPFDALNPLHPIDLAELRFTAADALRIAAVGVLLALLGYGVWRRAPQAALLAAGLLALFPVLNVVPISIGRNIGHERYLTFPLTLFVLAVTTLPAPPWTSREFRSLRFAAGAVGVTWLGLAIAGICVTVPLWQSELTLWSWAAARHPQSDYAHHMVVLALLHAQRLDLAGARLTEPVPSSPYRAVTQLEYARHLFNAGRLEESEQHLRRSLQGFPPWHVQPPRSPREVRDFDTYRGYAAFGYLYLAEIEEHAGNAEAARAARALAQQYAAPP